MQPPPGRHRATAHRQPGRVAAMLAAPLGVALSATLVWSSSQSAFSGTTVNPGNALTAGSVSLTDDDTGTAMFSVTGLKPGSTGSRCIQVTYAGSLASTVKVYVAPGGLTGTGLGTYLHLTVEEGTPGTYSSCSTFAATATDYTGTLSGFAASATSFATGVGAWAPTGAGQVKTYRVTYTLQDNNAAQSLSATVAVTWEAQNS